MSGSSSPSSSSRTLFHELDKDANVNVHERYRDALADDHNNGDNDNVHESTLASLEETELGLLHNGKSQYSDEKQHSFSPDARRRKASSNSRCYAVLAAVLFLLVALAFFATMRILQSRTAVATPPSAVPPSSSNDGVNSPSDEAVKQVDPAPAPVFPPQVLGPPTDSFWDNLRNDTLYMTGWFSAGWTNDFMTIVNMLYVAFLANRTGVIPPFAPSHVSSSGGHPPFSEVFDLPRMASSIGIPLIEWSDLKKVPSSSSTPDALGCWSVWATTKPSDNSPRTGPIPGYLGLDVSYTPVPRNTVPTNDQHVHFAPLAAITFPDGRKHSGLPREAPYPSPGAGHRLLPSERMACFDFLYYASSVYPFEYAYDFSPAWRFIGRHAHWTPRIRTLAEEALAHAFSLPSSSPSSGSSHTNTGTETHATGTRIPPYIAVHIRHGDFAGSCPFRGDTNGTDSHLACFASLERYVAQVDAVKAELKEKIVRGEKVLGLGEDGDGDLDVENLRVLVTSDEKSVAWWTRIRELGWTWIDHTALDTEGKYGKWYPVFIDAAAQSLAVGFVGTRGSTMSLMAGRRVVDWSGGVTRDINGAPDATDKRRRQRRSTAEGDDDDDNNSFVFDHGLHGDEFVV